MSKCSVKFVPALFAGVVAGTNLATVTDLRAQTMDAVAEAPMQLAQVADSCRSAPSGATPAGSHWYYRIDRVTKRQCWYLREESEKADDKFARAAPPESAPATPPTADESRTRKFAEARAEYVAQQPRAEAVRAETRSIEAAPAPVAQNQRAAMPNVLAPAPLSSMRWNDAATASASTNPAPLQVAAVAAAPVEQQPQQSQTEYAQQPTAEQIAAVAVEPAKPPTASLQKLLLVMAAALALAGLTVSAIVRIGRMRARRAMRKKRRAMWDSARVKKRAPQPMFHDEDAKLRRAPAMQPARAPRDHAFQERGFQGRGFQDRPFQDQPSQNRALQDRAFQERTRVPRERSRAAPESYAPANRRPVSQEREREQQVTEMLARLARSAQT
ncbi:hypothetical protein [Bradyrhizobium sp. CB3481]|uniref:hypothetical protein n=1 Tax=Bradyrhizobium sp. CB3481 TaxID=3039158 RepID=UPI0024B1D3E3|nr:hypothetical protein [Bradyrhizobium sp. CB3481]WFU14043.1 hypothetical protein QA643_22755 [Bradyrhizobium sp. CB3481]